jgi:predicted permease
MKALRRVWNRLAGSLAGGRREAELADEFESHIGMLTEENLRRGMSPAEARRAALLVFGGVEAAKESYRDQRGLPTLDSVRQDVRYALRGMRRNPVFTAVAVACLALGIGANTAIFSLINAVMIRSLPVHHPEQLVFFQYASEGDISAVQRMSSGYGQYSLPYATYEALRDHARTLAGVSVFVSLGVQDNGVTINMGGQSMAADGEMVTGSYFSELGISPIVGRTIVDDDLNPGSPDVAVISHRFWLRELGEERSAVGRSITVNGLPFMIIGVIPPGFAGLTHGTGPDIWVPLRNTPGLTPWGSQAAVSQSIFTDRRYWWCTIVGRRKPGVTQSQVLAEADFLFRQSITAGLNQIPTNLPKLTASGASPGFDMLRKKFSAPLRILMGTAALVLLIACANVATLLVARAKARQKEIGVRLAIGASRARLIRQLLTESVLLSLCGGSLGLLCARWGGPALMFLIPGSQQAASLDVSPDATVLAFVAAVSVVTGILFGLAPALRAARVDLAPQLTEAAASTTPRPGMARMLVASQIALSVVLLFGAGLFVRTFRNLNGQELGFQRDNLLLFELDPERNGYTAARGIALHDRLLARIQELPGVRSGSFSQIALLSGWSNTSPSSTDSGAALPPGQPNGVHWNRVGPRFFETLGIRVRIGHGIGWRDTDANHPVAVVNESWARAFYPNENPIGHHISGGNRFDPLKAYEIVGVAEDAKYDRMRDAPPRTVYISYGAPWDRPRRMCFVVRTVGDPLAMSASVREAVREIDPNLPLFNLKTQSRQIEEALGQDRMLAHISSFFGTLALLLVAVGLYGTLSYTVTQRTGEIGIRMALGARRAEVVWMILREALVIAILGLAVGLPVALAMARLVASSLFGIQTYDAATIAATVFILSAIAAVAGFLPANRASRIDPIRALRHE